MLAARISESKQAMIKYGWEFLTTRAARFWYRGWSKLSFYDSRSRVTSLLKSRVRILVWMHALISRSSPSILHLESGKCCKMYFHTSALIVSIAAPSQGALGRELGDTFTSGLLSLGPLQLMWGVGSAGCQLRALRTVALHHTIENPSEQIFTWRTASVAALWRKSLALELK